MRVPEAGTEMNQDPRKFRYRDGAVSQRPRIRATLALNPKEVGDTLPGFADVSAAW